MENEKVFTFDVKRIYNGFIIYHGDRVVYRERSNQVNEFIEAALMGEIKDHVVAKYPQGTAERLVVTIGVMGKVME